MPGTVITLSPNLPLDRAERVVRGLVERDGGVELAAASGDARQLRHFRRLAGRLRADARLACFSFSETPDGGTYLTVLDAEREVNGWWWCGNAKIS